MTAFHVALHGGHAKIVNHFFENYPPKGGEYEDIYRCPESKSNVRLALDTKEPEMVWLVLDKNICTEEERDAAWEIVKGNKFKSSISPADKYSEFVNLFGTYGGYSLESPGPGPESSPIPDLATLSMESSHINGVGAFQSNGNRRPHPTVQVDSRRSHTASPVSATFENIQTPTSATSSPRGYRGQHNRRGSFRPHRHSKDKNLAHLPRLTNALPTRMAPLVSHSSTAIVVVVVANTVVVVVEGVAANRLSMLLTLLPKCHEP